MVVVLVEPSWQCFAASGLGLVVLGERSPGGQDEDTVRGIIADLDARVRNLLVELVPDIELPRSVLDERTSTPES